MHLRAFLSAHTKTILALVAASIFSIATVYATPPGSAYSPGETLDPSCAPGDTNCSVTISGNSLLGSTSTLGTESWFGVDVDEISGSNASTDNTVFIGQHAGYGTTNSDGSIALGYAAGAGAANSDGAIFIGTAAGSGGHDIPGTIAIGDTAGFMTEMAYSIIVGYQAGQSTTGSGNFIAGSGAAFEAIDLSDSFVGGNGAATSSDTIAHAVIIGDDAGTFSALHSDAVLIGSNAGKYGTSIDNSIFIGKNSGIYSQASNAILLGQDAGNNAINANNSVFIGQSTGFNSTDAQYSNFIGYQAGEFASNASNSNFIGNGAGVNALNAYGSSFIGNNAGVSASNSRYSVFLGEYAGNNATNAAHSTFVGENAGLGATNASNSIFIGKLSGSGDTVNNTNDINDFSILIGPNSHTGGFSNSIAFGGYATNTASNQLMVGSSTRRIDNLVFNGGTGNTCTVNASTGITCSSDERLKTNIRDIDSALNNIMNIRTVNYNWKSDPEGQQMVGFIAQNLQDYFPQLVSSNIDGMLSVNYAQITPVLTRAIQELNIKVESLSGIAPSGDMFGQVISWLANASNHITRIFTGEICLTDPDGTSECLNKQELGQLKQLLSAPAQESQQDSQPQDQTEVTQQTADESTTPTDNPIEEPTQTIEEAAQEPMQEPVPDTTQIPE